MFGFLNINKSAGPTSHDVVAQVRRLLPRNTKVGHAGTLDPFASGVLVVCVGPATRLAEYVQRQTKRYTAQITLGATSTTDDAEGEVRAWLGPPAQASHGRPARDSAFLHHPDQRNIQDVLSRFVGDIKQIPPAHSAVHVNGRRAYQLARAGETLDLPARPVTIHGIQLLHYAWPVLEIDVQCGSGTYIRALARDVGQTLGVGGYCSSLTRTAVGPFTLDQAVAIDDLDLTRDLLPPTTGLDLPTVHLDEDQIVHLRHGRAVLVPPAAPLPDADVIALLDQAGQLLALAQPEGQRLQPTKVFIT